MESLRELYRIGAGPSSSHTMGPRKAAEVFLSKHDAAASFRVTLFGALAATGGGHLTDEAIRTALAPRTCEIVWRADVVPEFHTNGMEFAALDEEGIVLDTWRVYSIGGGAICEEDPSPAESVYPLSTMSAIETVCEEGGIPLWQYVEKCEDERLWPFLDEIWDAMSASIERGLASEGALPGGLALRRKARSFLRKAQRSEKSLRRTGLLSAYALAVSEENAAGGVIVTAPTCGASGVLPAVLRYLKEENAFSRRELVQALATAGLIGLLVKTNASISGAEVGCQGEVGAACAMAAAAAAQLQGGTVRQVEYAAEMGMEHHLGLTCDPLEGLVQIPCIERNAFAATRAVDCADYALLSDGSHRISFDEVIETMRETGRDLASPYRETSTGGLAAAYKRRRRREDAPDSV